MDIIIKKYFDELRANGIKQSTINKIRPTLKQLDDFLDGDIKNATKEDVTGLVLSWSTATESTIATRKSIIKNFFIWVDKEEIVKHLKIKMPKSKLRPEDILTPEDVDKLIDATPSHFYMCLIAVLWETGCRLEEAKALKIVDFRETDDGMVVSIPTFKTNYPCRNMLLIYSAQYVRNYKTYSGKSDDDIVFDVHRATIHNMFQKLKKQTGIKKPISPHKFRHAQATHMVKQSYQEAIIRKKMGWTDTSPMLANYQHLCDTDVINAQLAMNGEISDRTKIPEIKTANEISIADTSSIISKQSLEIETLKEEYEKLNKQHIKSAEYFAEMTKTFETAIERVKNEVIQETYHAVMRGDFITENDGKY